MALKRYVPIVIEPDPLKQGYMYQAIRAEADFIDLKNFRSVEAALQFLRSSPPIDVIIISATFSQYVINQFIDVAKKSGGGKEAAYVLLTPTDDESRESVATSMIDGMDGILFSPISVHSVKEVARIAAEVRKKFEDKRKKAAMQVLLPDFVALIDDLSYLESQKISTKTVKKKIKKLHDSIAKVREEFWEEYFEQLFKLCVEAKPREKNTAFYTGASRRLRARFGKKETPTNL